MDSTLLGAFIGAGAAIAGSIVTAIATYHINKLIDKNKLLIEKKRFSFRQSLKLKGPCTDITYVLIWLLMARNSI